jgi:hypothetical protein
MKLWEFDRLIDTLIAENISPETGEISESIAAELDALEIGKDEKMLAVAHYIQGVRDRQKRLREKARVAQNRIDSLKTYLGSYVQPGQKLKDEEVSIGWTNRSVLEVPEGADLSTWDERFIERRPNEKALKAALAEDEVVPEGVELVKRASLTIR